MPLSIRSGHGMCSVCARNDTEAARQAFYLRITELGGRIPKGTPWRGGKVPHPIICAAGHDARPRPGDVLKGNGPCVACARRSWDVFYVVSNADLERIKYGITEGDPRIRLGAHRRTGYREVIRLRERLVAAIDLERAVASGVRLAGLRPVRGREYLDVSALPVILDVVDHWASEA